MEKLDDLLEFAKGVDSIWSVLAFALLIFVVVFFVIWKTNKEIIINMFKKRQKSELFETLELIRENLSFLKSENTKVHRQLSIVVKDREQNKAVIEKMREVQDQMIILLTEKQRIKDFEEKNRIELNKLIKNELVTNKALKTFLVNGLSKGMMFFKSLRNRGLKSDFPRIEEDFKVIFKEVRNNVNLSALFKEHENNIELSKKYVQDLKVIVIMPNIVAFIVDFRDLQIKYNNGKLLNKFENLAELFIFTILKQSIKLYDKYDINNS
ncbi:MAG: hypothetical protein GY849_02440 [Deltaproteobacteria bacterium]|nr:hypothetical protein [Deltaproteobacteria bacterium]